MSTKYLWILVLVLIAVVFSLYPIEGGDIWWHLRTGQLIVESKSLPFLDFYSYTAFGRPWFNHEYLSQIVFYSVHKFFGVNGLILFGSAVVFFILYFFKKTIDRFGESFSLQLFFIFLGAWGMAARFEVRPELFTLLGASILSYFVWRYHLTGKGPIWVLIPLQVFLINCHAGAIILLVLILLFSIGFRLQKRFNGRGYELPVWLPVAMISASFANPFTWQVFSFPWIHNFMNEVISGTEEWQSPIFAPWNSYIVFEIFFVLAGVALILHAMEIRKKNIAAILLTLTTLFISLRSNRYTGIFILINAPIVWSLLWNRYPSWVQGFEHGLLRKWTRVFVAFCILAAFVWGVPFKIGGMERKVIGMGMNQVLSPSEAVSYLEEHGIHGRVFNSLGAGGYLIWRRWPGEMVFIDGRTPLYGGEFFKKYMYAWLRLDVFTELVEAYDIDYLFLLKRDDLGMRHDFFKWLELNSDWIRVYDDPFAIIYIKKDRLNLAKEGEF